VNNPSGRPPGPGWRETNPKKRLPKAFITLHVIIIGLCAVRYAHITRFNAIYNACLLYTYVGTYRAPGPPRRAEPIDFKRRPLFARHEKLALSAVRAAACSENVVQVFAPPLRPHTRASMIIYNTHLYIYPYDAFFIILLGFVSLRPDAAALQQILLYYIV